MKQKYTPNKPWLVFLISLLHISLILGGCQEQSKSSSTPSEPNSSSTEPSPSQEVSLDIQVHFPEPSLSNPAARTDSTEVAISLEAVASVVVSVSEGSHVLISQQPLAKNETNVWQAHLAGLPQGQELTFTAMAYSAEGEELFTGTQVQTIESNATQININLQSLTPRSSLAPPGITRLEFPSEVQQGGVLEINAVIEGNDGDIFSYELYTSNPAETPASLQSGTINLVDTLLDTRQQANLQMVILPPSELGTQPYVLHVSNQDSFWIETEFEINVVDTLPAPQISVRFNPIIESFGGRRSGDQITWEASVLEGAASLSYEWSFQDSNSQGASLEGAIEAQPQVSLINYTPDQEGILSLSINDINGANTTINYPIFPGQFGGGSSVSAGLKTGPLRVQLGSGNGDEIGRAITTDAAGNVYVAGETSGTLFGESIGSQDGFLVKYDAQDNLVWSQQFGAASSTIDDVLTEGHIHINSMTLDASGNIYLAGHVLGEFGEETSGSQDAFYMQYNSAGELQWIKRYATSIPSEVLDIKVGVDTIYLLIQEHPNTTVSAVVALDFERNERWAHGFDLGYIPTGHAKLLIDEQQNVYVAGRTSKDLETQTFLPSSLQDVFLVKYNAEGLIQWSEQKDLGGSQSKVHGLFLDEEGLIHIAGNKSRSLGGQYIQNPFLVSYTTEGVEVNTTQLEVDSDFYVFTSAAFDGAGQLYFTGYSGTSIWILSINTSGEILAEENIGSSPTIGEGFGVTATTPNTLYLTGRVYGNLAASFNFGSDAFAFEHTVNQP